MFYLSFGNSLILLGVGLVFSLIFSVWNLLRHIHPLGPAIFLLLSVIGMIVTMVVAGHDSETASWSVNPDGSEKYTLAYISRPQGKGEERPVDCDKQGMCVDRATREFVSQGLPFPAAASSFGA